MTKQNKSKRGVPATIKTVVSVIEFVARGIAAYLILNNFDHIVAVYVGLYMVVTASIILIGVFYKAFK